MRNIPFSRPVRVGAEPARFAQVLAATRSGRDSFARRCEELLRALLRCEVLVVSSATHALELAGMLPGLGRGDEVTVPSFTISSTVNAYLLRGARIRFADVDANGNLDPAEAARLVSARTRAVVPVHYGGHCCDLVELQAGVGNTAILEDAAHAMGASFRRRPPGPVGRCGPVS